MTTKVLNLALTAIKTTDAQGNAIVDPIGTVINNAYKDQSMAGFTLVAAYPFPPSNPNEIVLYFQKP
jgi:hypothetical protein